MKEVSLSPEFNNLEKAILRWFIDRYKDENLSAQISVAKLKGRKWTKAGFYIELDVPSDANTIDISKLKNKKWPIDGPEIKSADIEDGGGSLLWGEEGRIVGIELYAYGHLFKGNIKSFELFSPK